MDTNDHKEKRQQSAVIEHSHIKLPIAPLSMQGDGAIVWRINSDEKYLYPKNLRDFKMIEFAKELKCPFRYTTIDNIAIYYSTVPGLELNKEASDCYGVKFYGDVIIVPQDLMPKL
jgi:hypothetical protein|tara:strand:+ start:70 stop:417 length:348 start_codon:yes stop_codon:yes gene_type:complete